MLFRSPVSVLFRIRRPSGTTGMFEITSSDKERRNMTRQPALGTLVTNKKGQDASSPYEFAIPLCDLLLDLVEQDIDGPDTLLLTEIAHSFAHDIVNVATLAGKLLWYEGVTSDLSRSPDLVSVAVDIEGALTFLRSACDVIAPLFARFAVTPEKGKVSKRATDSFNGLLNWVGLGDRSDETQPEKERAKAAAKAKANYALVSMPFHFLEKHSKWFLHLKSLRDKLTHKGFSLVPYTERIFLEAHLMAPGKAELQWLHGGYKQEDYQEDTPPRFKRYKLVDTLKEFTAATLDLANDFYNAISQEKSLFRSQNHFLSGIHIPALSELLSYEPPSVPDGVRGFQSRKLRAKALYLLRAGDYSTAHQEGYPDGFWWVFKVRLTEIFGRPPVRVLLNLGRVSSGPSHKSYIFCFKGKHYGILTDGLLSGEENEFKELQVKVLLFKDKWELDGAVLLCSNLNSHTEYAEIPSSLGNDLIQVGHDPIKAAESVFIQLTSRAVIPSDAKWDNDPHAQP